MKALTGKALKDFIEYHYNQIDFTKESHEENYEMFLHQTEVTHQLASIIEWLDSVGIYVTVEGVFDRMLGYNRGYEVHIYQDGRQPISIFDDGDVFPARQKATENAIEKAIEIYNEKHK